MLITIIIIIILILIIMCTLYCYQLCLIRQHKSIVEFVKKLSRKLVVIVNKFVINLPFSLFFLLFSAGNCNNTQTVTYYLLKLTQFVLEGRQV